MPVGLASDPAMMFLALLGGHALGDYGLQTAYMAFGKDRHAVDEHGNQKNVHWFPVLFAHAAIHGLFVGLATGYAWLGLAELVAHFMIHDAKSAGKFSYGADQFLHYGCKIVWGLVAISLSSSL
ncbi:DUF3307 domain-containing protein [Sphingomonas sp. 3-13AW]|uniref:DUF3307 domain-containing protein n=1 Tax=Sphingomonas sp. 3-13AW TaxID=3050450 RepID=UPI003BB48FA7